MEEHKCLYASPISGHCHVIQIEWDIFTLYCTFRISSVMAKSFQPVVVRRSYKDWKSVGPVKVLVDLNNFGPKLFGLFFNII